jgi:polygalacturonase
VAITVTVGAIGSETGAFVKTITVELCRANHTRICVLPP